MSASEVLEQVKALPPQERYKLFQHIRELEAAIGAKSTLPTRGVLARQLMGAGRHWLKPGADPIGELIREREQDENLDQSDQTQ